MVLNLFNDIWTCKYAFDIVNRFCMKKTFRKLIEMTGYTVAKVSKDDSSSLPLQEVPDIREKEFHELYAFCKPYTMTSVERMYALYTSVNYVLSNNIAGCFTECGVWRGGSAMLIAMMLSKRGLSDRKIYLYDTFEGMPAPGANDVDMHGKDAAALMHETEDAKETSVWCLADEADVRRNMALTGYNPDNIVFIKGKVEETIPQILPDDAIALLRLDTDWYESTRHELIHLYPKLAGRGVLIVDDYGHWEGCRKAVDEYFAENKVTMLLNRIDYTGRVGIKMN